MAWAPEQREAPAVPVPLLPVADREHVTGEAVALAVPVAGVGLRVLSGLIDLVIDLVVLFGLTWMIDPIAQRADPALSAAVSLLAVVAALIALPTALETLTRGRTLGKLVTGLRTVRDDLGPIGFRHALTRALIAVVEVWITFAVVAVVAEALSTRGKRLGDAAAGTLVVHDRVPLVRPGPVLMPPQLETWARGADLRALPGPLASAARNLLRRFGTLTQPAQESMAVALANEVARYVAPPPPAGTPPTHFLAAVLAERRRRDEIRLRAEDEVRRTLFPDSP